MSGFAAEQLGRVLVRLADSVEHDVKALQRLLAAMRRAQSARRGAQASVAGQRGGEVDDSNRRPTRPADQRRVPAHPEVRIQADPHPCAEAAIRCDRVEVPALIPQLLGTRGVTPLILGRRTQRHGLYAEDTYHDARAP